MEQHRRKLVLPHLSKVEWSDIRREYESGMSVNAIAEAHVCDPRTVRRALKYNYSSTEIGKRIKPVITDRYREQIREYFQQFNSGGSLHAISCKITEQLRKEEYAGSERTIRNYLMKQPYVMKMIEETGHAEN